MDASAYLESLGVNVRKPARSSVGRLALSGEFELDSARGVILRPKRRDVSNRYLELLADAGYDLVAVDGDDYPSFYAREGASLAPVRALPISKPAYFPSTEVLEAWSRLIRASAGRVDAARLGVKQVVARMDDVDLFGPELVRSSSDVTLARLGGDVAVEPEALRTAAALLAGYRTRPESPNELARLGGALSSLLADKGQFSGMAEKLTPLLGLRHLGERRLLVSGGAGAELSALIGSEGTAVLPITLRPLKPVLERSLPNVEYVFADFLQTSFESDYNGVVVVPPPGHQLSGRELNKFELSKRGGKARPRVSAELLYVEHALAATAAGGLLVTILPEGLLSSAGHADFRAWLLNRARLLAVMSLPVGACFKGIGVRCSIVLLMKSAPPEDYPIMMLDVESDELNADIGVAKSKLDEFLNREVPACA